MNDIFKDMQAKVGCEYIFDLPIDVAEFWCIIRCCLAVKQSF